MKFRFWTLTFATVLSKIGNQLLYVAIPWAVLQNTRSPVLAVVSLGVQSIPYIASPVLGGIVDRYDKRHVFTISEIMQAICVALLPLFLIRDQLPVVFILLTVGGFGGVVSGLTSDYGLIPSVVSSGELGWANSRYTTAVQIARFVGPTIAGILLVAVGDAWTIWIDAFSFLATALIAQILPPRAKVSPLVKSPFNYFYEGICAFRQRQAIKSLTITLTIYNIGTGSLFALMVTVAKLHWHWNASLFGIALSGGAAAGAFGAWLADSVWRKRKLEQRILLWLSICAVGGATLLLTIPLLTLLGYYILCAGEGGMNVASMTFRQENIQPELVGRVNAIVRMFVLGSIPLSSVILGGLSSFSDQRIQFIPAVLAASGAFLTWKWWLTRQRAVGR